MANSLARGQNNLFILAIAFRRLTVARVRYPGAIYPVMNRGDRWEPIFFDDQDRVLFMDTLSEVCGKTEAERFVAEELLVLGWDSRHLQARRKGDPRKARIALRLRRETTMTRAWIGTHLHMGSPGHVNCLLYR